MKNSTVGDAISSGASGANTETTAVEVAAAGEEVEEEAGKTGVKNFARYEKYGDCCRKSWRVNYIQILPLTIP